MPQKQNELAIHDVADSKKRGATVPQRVVAQPHARQRVDGQLPRESAATKFCCAHDTREHRGAAAQG
jgi:hypothetical protein